MLGKIVSLLISPLGTALWLLAIGLLLSQLARRPGWRKAGIGVAAAGFAWLWVWSMPVASEGLRGWLENQAGPRTLDAMPAAPVLVVLGGGVSGPRLPLRPDPDLAASADRMWHAARLYRAGKAQKLILSGGTVRTGDASEAEAMQAFLLDLGVPASAMVLETGSTDTRGNARQTARLLAAEQVDTVMLVTSALHMPRARKAFEQAGLKVIPAPTDFEVIEAPADWLRWLPDAAALNGSARAMKELVGQLTRP
jgi:uncharacterized SAM-binding protein YcdF (DUF218 family)